MLRPVVCLSLSAALLSAPAAALPEGSVEVGIGAAVGSGAGAVLGAATAYLLLVNGLSLSSSVGNNDAAAALALDGLALPAIGVVGGAAVGAFAVSAFQGNPISPAPVTAGVGAGVVGSVCAAPFCMAGVSAFDQANQASNCSDACALAIGGLFFFGLSYVTFCATGPVGAGLGGGVGAAFVAPEVPPEGVELPEGPSSLPPRPTPPATPPTPPPTPLPPPPKETTTPPKTPAGDEPPPMLDAIDANSAGDTDHTDVAAEGSGSRDPAEAEAPRE